MNEISTNLALEIINEILEDKSSANNGFIIDNDEKAEWALKKIFEEKAECQRYINVCRSIILEYEDKIRQSEEKLKNKISFLEGQLQNYFKSTSRKITKTQETYRLPSGTLRLKYQQPEFKRDEKQFLKWLKDNEMKDFIKVEEKPNWGEFKKLVVISAEKVITHDGQIVEGIEVIEKPPVFEVDV